MSDTAAAVAPAKVNLFLHVVRERPDGYHELDTLFQAIDLADEITVQLGGVGLELYVDGADLGPREDNLAFRAASRFLSAAGLDVGIRIQLRKQIPVGAGLGGGSSDAAAVLRALSYLIDDRGDGPRIQTLAAELGSDVPFFLGRSALARGSGRGELLEPLSPLPEADLVLVSPPVRSSTAAAYRSLARARRDGAHETAPTPPPPTSWQDVEAIAHNDFQALIASEHAEVARSLQALEHAGASVALLSGSGSTSLGLFADRAAAERAAEGLTEELGWPCRAVRTLQALPVPRLH